MTRFERYTVWGSTVAVSATGFAYAGVKYLVPPTDPFAVVNHPLQPMLLKLHVLTAPLFVFAIGLIALRHIWPHFRARVKRGRRSGLSAAAVLLPMVASGYLIQTVTQLEWLDALVIVHLVTGTVFALGAAAHRIAAPERGRGPPAAERAGPARNLGDLDVPDDGAEADRSRAAALGAAVGLIPRRRSRRARRCR